jgi:hypothetical protein
VDQPTGGEIGEEVHSGLQCSHATADNAQGNRPTPDPLELTAVVTPATDHFRLFSSTGGRTSPLYSAIAERVAEVPDVANLIELAPIDQQRPMLLFAAVHDLLLEGVDDPLAECYPSLGGHADLERAPDEFIRFCRAHRDALEPLVTHRTTQTNEVGRCAALLPAFSAIAASGAAQRPLALVEVGASAGLNLRFDRYLVDYPPVGVAGDLDSEVHLSCTVRSEGFQLPLAPPVAARLGLDVSPLDAHDDRDARWLLACTWADDLPRFERLRHALAAARDDTPEVVLGDAVDDLAAVVDDAVGRSGGGAHVVVFHSWAVTYLPAERRQQFATTIAELSRDQDLSWLIVEQRELVPELPFPLEPARKAGATELIEVEHRDGRPRPRRLGEMHPHGRWLDWQV